MTLFEEIVNESFLLNELRSGDAEERIIDAINKALRVRMVYDDGKGGKGKNERFILPVAFGLTKSGKKAVRAYETMGSSKRGITNPPNRREHPKWKLFLYDNIISWSNGKRNFLDKKGELLSAGFNAHGDKGMTRIFAISPFADDDIRVTKDTSSIGVGPVTKSDVVPTPQSQKASPSQEPNTISAQASRNSSLDNAGQNSYFTNKVESPSTEPVTKTDVAGSQSSPAVNTVQPTPMARSTKPVMKTDVGGETETPAVNTVQPSPLTRGGEKSQGGENVEDVKSRFNDLIKRMKKAENPDNEEEKGVENGNC